MTYHLDADLDGFGTSNPTGDTLCVCDAFADAAENRTARCNPVVGEAQRVNVEFGDSCWSPVPSDCADNVSYIHPPRPGEEHPEWVDGYDNDCDGYLALLELDCDEDGELPAEWYELASSGLGSCEGREAPALRCFGLSIPVLCRGDVWVVPMDLLESAGRASGPVRTYTVPEGMPCVGIDCDDRCPNRCRGRAEACDGVDNDCWGTDVSVDADLDGFPDALDPDAIPVGTVDPAEADVLPAGWLYECDPDLWQQTAVPPSACEPLDTVARPDDEPADDTDDEAAGAGCGCGPGAAPTPIGLVAGLAALALARRRGRLATALLAASLGVAGPARAQCGAEIFYNGVDDDCQGGSDYDQDGDGFDCDSSSVIGAGLCPGFVGGTDCDDLQEHRRPGVEEDCEAGGPFAQIDDDCDGSVNTQGGEYFADTAQLGANASPRFPDGDGDGYGAGDPVYLCHPNVEPESLLFAVLDGDCDDTDPALNPGVAETCDGRDEDCDGVVDDPGPEPQDGAAPYWLDEDGDGFAGDRHQTAFCPLLVADPARLTEACNPNVTDPTRRVNVAFDDRCWGPVVTDCEDLDGSVHPGVVDVVDGIDTDCDGHLPLVELDCDDDGGLPVAFGADPRAGVATCEGRDTPLLTCFDTNIALSCRGDVWTVAMQLVHDLEIGVGPYRRYTWPTSCTDLDCDDLCPSRCGGRAEACDGVDNDCSDTDGTVDADQDALPDALDPAAVPVGAVDPAEADLAPDGALYECDGGTGEQTEVPPSTCEPLDTVPRPEPDEDEDAPGGAGCGCATGAPSAAPLLEPDGLRVEHYHREDDGSWRFREHSGDASLEVLGVACAVASFFRNLPAEPVGSPLAR